MVKMRDVRPEDKDMLRDWRNLPEVAKYMYTDHQIGPEEHERWFRSVMQDPTRRYWIITHDDEDVGLANLVNIDRHNQRCYWAMYVARARGSGIGASVEYFILQYAFQELKLNKLCGEVLSFNELILKMHQKFGFVQEGRLRQHIFRDGVFHDVITIGILREEWLKVQPEVEARLRQRGLLV